MPSCSRALRLKYARLLISAFHCRRGDRAAADEETRTAHLAPASKAESPGNAGEKISSTE